MFVLLYNPKIIVFIEHETKQKREIGTNKK